MKTSRRKAHLEGEGKVNKGIIDSWLEEHGDPSIDRLVKKNLAISQKIKDLLDHKQLKASQLAQIMGKQKSEVSKWLSGQHTFSMRTIAAIENALESDIVHIEPQINQVYLTRYVRSDAMTKVEEEYKFEDSVYIGEFKTA